MIKFTNRISKYFFFFLRTSKYFYNDDFVLNMKELHKEKVGKIRKDNKSALEKTLKIILELIVVVFCFTMSQLFRRD